MIKVLVADDHPIFRSGLKQILSDVPDIRVTGEAKDGHDVLNLVRESHYDVVVLDISMPGMDGLEVLKHLKQVKTELPVLILSVHPDEQYGLRAMKAGASGYLTKNSPPEELVAAIRKVKRGRKYLSASLTDQIIEHLDDGRARVLHESLSDREFKVMHLIANGKSPGEIAEELSLSVKTVSTYRTRIMEKMNMKTNANLIRYCIENGLLL